MRECRGRRWGLSHAPLRAGSVMAPRCVSRRSSPPARSVRVSHDSDPASGHAPCPRPKPCPKPKPNPNPHPYLTAGRRGRKEGARLTLLPTGDHLGQRARLFVAPQPKPIAAANLCSRSRSRSPSHPAATAPNLLLSLNPRPPHQARLGGRLRRARRSCLIALAGSHSRGRNRSALASLRRAAVVVHEDAFEHNATV